MPAGSKSVSSPPIAGPRRITAPQFSRFKAEGRKIAVLTAYDYPTARLLDACGIEGILVGDSLGMVVQGKETTLPVTLDEIIYHAEMVGRGVEQALVVVDLPFGTYNAGRDQTIQNAARILKETRCQAVKLEGTAEQAETIAALVSAGIPVMAHCGLRPQSVHQLGGYSVQRDEERLLKDARAAEQAGAFAIVLECIPGGAARRITRELAIPTIGIGAGPGCDGQVLVTHDMLGLTSGYVPKFVRPFADLGAAVREAVTRYRDAVREGAFPGDKESYA
jgi:3-methyl-2-oxobutanoate hydroxymethyltransferase